MCPEKDEMQLKGSNAETYRGKRNSVQTPPSNSQALRIQDMSNK